MKRLQTRGFGLKETHSDQQFKKACEIFRSKHDPPIKFNYANAKEHVPRAERNIRTTKERICSSCHQMPCKHLPKKLVEHLGIGSDRELNYFPAKHGVNKHYSPRMVLHQENLEYE